MAFLDKTRMLSGYWRRSLNPYEAPGTGGEETGEVEEVASGGSVLRDILVWSAWGFALIVAIALVVLLFGLVPWTAAN